MKMTLGAFIAQLRKEKGLTQKQLSEILGVSDKTISHWEREESAPDISILPILAHTLGVTADELLAGSISSPAEPIEQFAAITQADKTANSYRIFKISNSITAAFSLLCTVIASGGVYLFRLVTLDHTANYIAFFATLGGVSLSAVLTVIFNIVFASKLNPKSDTYDKYLFNANRISTLNIYLCLMCISANLIFTGRYGFLFVAVALLLCLIIEKILKSTKVLALEKAFETENKKSVYLLRKSCTVLCAILVILGSLGHFFISDCWNPNLYDKVFNSADEFKAYMETPYAMPEDAWQIDGVKTTTAPPTTSSNQNDKPLQPPAASVTPDKETGSAFYETVYDDDGNEIVTFMFRNNAVYKYTYSSDGKFRIITYDSMRKAETINHFRNHTLDFLMPLYYVVVIIISVITYKKKLANLSN